MWGIAQRESVGLYFCISQTAHEQVCRCRRRASLGSFFTNVREPLADMKNKATGFAKNPGKVMKGWIKAPINLGKKVMFGLDNFASNTLLWASVSTAKKYTAFSYRWYISSQSSRFFSLTNISLYWSQRSYKAIKDSQNFSCC